MYVSLSNLSHLFQVCQPLFSPKLTSLALLLSEGLCLYLHTDSDLTQRLSQRAASGAWQTGGWGWQVDRLQTLWLTEE